LVIGRQDLQQRTLIVLGALIARDKVLTAAHCLFNRATHRFLQMAITWFMLIMHVVKETRLLTL
jgi:hypothetical protein